MNYYENGKRIAPTHVLSEAAKLLGIDEFDFYEYNMEALQENCMIRKRFLKAITLPCWLIWALIFRN